MIGKATAWWVKPASMRIIEARHRHCKACEHFVTLSPKDAFAAALPVVRLKAMTPPAASPPTITSSERKVRQLTDAVYPLSTCSTSPVAQSTIRTVWSPLQGATNKRISAQREWLASTGGDGADTFAELIYQ